MCYQSQDNNLLSNQMGSRRQGLPQQGQQADKDSSFSEIAVEHAAVLSF